jgi:translation initiation factor 2B subunit (eIF-2B alpha/beta/delta family)
MEHSLNREHLLYYNQELAAKSAVQTVFELSTTKDPFEKIILSRDFFINKYKGNIVLQNSLNYILNGLGKENLENQLKTKKLMLFKEFSKTKTDITNILNRKIPRKSTIFLHSLNNTLFESVLNLAKNKEATLIFLDSHPQEFGNAMHQSFKNHKIKHLQFSDLQMGIAISKSDFCLIGVDAIKKNGNAIVKTGTQTALKVSKENHTKTYLVANTWGIDTTNSANNLFNQNTQTDTKYEEIIKPVESYITEQGIFDFEHVVRESKFFNKNLI